MVDAPKKNLEGKTCADCIHYRVDKFNPRKGTCYGRQVCVANACNCLIPKT
jgi:hypothetical protein